MKYTTQLPATSILLRSKPARESVPDNSVGPVLVIETEVSQACSSQFGQTLRAVVLTGSLARGEGSFVSEASIHKFYGDAEFILLFRDGIALPKASVVESLQAEIRTALTRRGIDCSVCLSAAHSDYLKKMPPSIFAYELRTRGRSILGSQEVLDIIPAFRPGDIPLEDAWRLLANRMIEQLEAVDAIRSDSPHLPSNLFYRTVKLYLDIATSLLVFLGAYEPTYESRAARLRTLATRLELLPCLPFSLDEFTFAVNACTEWKLAPKESKAEGTDWSFWITAVSYACQLWRWELARLAVADGHLSTRTLMKLWMERQSKATRWRGWIYVARKRGWLKSLRHWPTWAIRARQASPRDCVYAAAGELFPKLSDLVRPVKGTIQDELDWDLIRARLPLRIAEKHDAPWRQLAAEISWNYHQFLEGTRA